MAPIIMKYQKSMPQEYVTKVSGYMAKSEKNPNGFTDNDFAAIDSQNPTQILKLVLGDRREETAKHVAEWFTVDWPRYAKFKEEGNMESNVDNSISDCARFITNKYALEHHMQMSIKDTLNKDFKGFFENAVEKAKKDSPSDPTEATNNIQSSLAKDFEDYYRKHYAS
jgi:hypothetical protein